MKPTVMLETIKKLMNEHGDRNYIQGLYEGLLVAQEISGWWRSNNERLEPNPNEVLSQWTDESLSKLEHKIETLRSKLP